MPTADPTLATLARLVDHERWPAAHGLPFGWSGTWVRREPGILWRWHADAGRWLPDPDDAATAGVLLGVLLALDPLLDVSGSGDGAASVAVQLPSGAIIGEYGPTLGRACVPALAAAWSIE